MTVARDGAGHGSRGDAELTEGDERRLNELVAIVAGLCRGPGYGRDVSWLSCELQVSERKVRALVTAARERAFPICGTPETGYFWPLHHSHADDTVEFLTKRMHSTIRMINGLKRGVGEEFGEHYEQLQLGYLRYGDPIEVDL